MIVRELYASSVRAVSVISDESTTELEVFKAINYGKIPHKVKLLKDVMEREE